MCVPVSRKSSTQCTCLHKFSFLFQVFLITHIKKYGSTKIVQVFFGKISSKFQELGTNKNNFSHFFVILLHVLFICNLFDITCNIGRYITLKQYFTLHSCNKGQKH